MGLRRVKERAKKFIAGCRLGIQRLRARAHSWAYALRFRVARLASRFGRWIAPAILILLLGLTVYLLPRLHAPLTTYYDDAERLASLRSLLQALGGALLGAAAIVSSLVLFAMQVNVERMPYGLFRQLGSDRKLLSAFAVTFVLALGVAALSAIPDRSWAPLAIVAAIWATVLILVFFLYAYRRALSLISPTMQVQFIIQDATKYLNMWARRAKRIAPLIQAQDEAPSQGDPRRTGHDTAGVVFYGLNAHWTEEPRRSLQYLVSIARRYAEKGDHDVAETALSGLVAINAAYVKEKGKTFFTTHFMIDHPLSTDGFVNAALEHLRQYAKAAIARRDEEQIEQAFRAFTALARVYVTIDYSDPHATKTNAGLAAGYLSQESRSGHPARHARRPHGRRPAHGTSGRGLPHS